MPFAATAAFAGRSSCVMRQASSSILENRSRLQGRSHCDPIRSARDSHERLVRRTRARPPISTWARTPPRVSVTAARRRPLARGADLTQSPRHRPDLAAPMAGERYDSIAKRIDTDGESFGHILVICDVLFGNVLSGVGFVNISVPWASTAPILARPGCPFRRSRCDRYEVVESGRSEPDLNHRSRTGTVER